MIVPHEVKMEITGAVSDIVKNKLLTIPTTGSTSEQHKDYSTLVLLISKLGHFLIFFLFSINRQASVIDFGIYFSGILLASLVIFSLGKLEINISSEMAVLCY